MRFGPETFPVGRKEVSFLPLGEFKPLTDGGGESWGCQHPEAGSSVFSSLPQHLGCLAHCRFAINTAEENFHKTSSF